MNIKCVDYHPSAKGGGTAKLLLALSNGPAILVSGWTIYEGSGKIFLNPPVAHRAGRIQNIVAFSRRSDRKCFRAAAVAAIQEYRAEQTQSPEAQQ